ncbi:unnamed protein product [Trichogramma brassicae]|uniref:Uncharacterized protein n=1 Tax=Trichogramma brassicae TaxID=86971 RepID=A0A6H5HYN4_9HYME|nr:unnamed protein product [Trichogramma brassicae]
MKDQLACLREDILFLAGAEFKLLTQVGPLKKAARPPSLGQFRNFAPYIDLKKTRVTMYPTTYLRARGEGGKLRRLNPLAITYTRPIRSRRNNPTLKVMRELPRKNNTFLPTTELCERNIRKFPMYPKISMSLKSSMRLSKDFPLSKDLFFSLSKNSKFLHPCYQVMFCVTYTPIRYQIMLKILSWRVK